MRKFFYYFTPRFWYGLVLIALIVFMAVGCAGISLKAPTTQMLIKTATFAVGYEIAKWDKEIAEEIIGHTEIKERVNVLVLYDNWKRYLVYRITDPICRRLVEDMLELVEVDWNLKSSVKQEEIVRGLFRSFIAGLEEGIGK